VPLRTPFQQQRLVPYSTRAGYSSASPQLDDLGPGCLGTESMAEPAAKAVSTPSAKAKACHARRAADPESPALHGRATAFAASPEPAKRRLTVPHGSARRQVAPSAEQGLLSIIWSTARTASISQGLAPGISRSPPAHATRATMIVLETDRCIPVAHGFCGKRGAPIGLEHKARRRGIAASMARRRNTVIGREGRASRRKIHV